MNRKKLIYPSLDNRFEKFKSPLRPLSAAMPTINEIYFPEAERLAKNYDKFMKGKKPRIPFILKIPNKPSKPLTCPHCGKDIKITLRKN